MGPSRWAVLACALACAACGDNLDGDAIDARAGNPDDDAAAAIDAAGSDPDAAVGVLCDTATCGADQECCLQGQSRTCVATGSCNGTNFDCDGLEDCATAGQVCCFGGGQGPNGGTSCVAAASCPAPTCASAADCTTGPNTMCCAVGQLQVCLAACPGA